MELSPRLIDVSTPADAVADVIVLHGGASRRRNMMVSPTQLSVLRMIPIAKRIARAGKGRLAVYRLLNSRRGWDTSHTPVRDAQWALSELEERSGHPRPTCLVGHSLGGRAAILAVTAPQVRSAVALAPYVYPTDVPRGLSDREILIVHGDRDRIASPQRALQLAERLSQRASVRFEVVEGGKHAMLSHGREFSSAAAEFAVETLLERD